MSASRSQQAKLNRFGIKLLLRQVIAFIVCLLAPAAVLADGTITGKVAVKETGEPLFGANVFLKGTTIGTVTNAEGAYTILRVKPGDYVLVASFVGYHTESTPITVTDNATVTANFAMRVDVFQGEAVVVTGIASRTSKELAEVAVSRVQATQLTESTNYHNFSQLVNGKVAGVNLTPSSGNVGAGFRFNVRSGGGLNGNEQPVIYVDGVRVNDDQFTGFGVGGQGISLLSSLNPEEIERFEVLKGPAGAASYGTNGSNGVVLITTRRGKLASGRNVAIDYKFITGSNQQAYEYSKSDYLTAANANRIFRTGNIQQHTVNATGGLNTLKYFVSFDKREEEGITRNNEGDRTSLRANLDVVPNERLTFQVNAGYTQDQLKRPNNDNNILGYLGNTLLLPRPYGFTDSTAIENIGDKTNVNRFIGAASAEYTPFKNLFGRFSVGVDNENLRQDQFFPVNLVYPVAQLDQGQRSLFNLRNVQYTYTLDGRYSFNLISRLNGSVVAGAQLFNRRQETSFISKFSFPSEFISNIGAGTQLGSADEGFTNTREAGIFAEGSFSYVDQYYATIGIRRDYASVIGKKAPSINYPKASLAVRLDRYAFFPNFFNLMKIRAAYGETGVLPGLLDGIELLYRAQGGGYGRGAVLSSIGNSEIKPERIKELEFGFDAQIFNNYAVEFTYYLQEAKDSIVGFRNSPSTGKIATAVPFNIGKIKGSGLEAKIDANPIRRRNLDINLSVIGNYQKNEVKDLGGAQPIFDGFDNNVIKEGLPKHQFYVRKVLGARFDPTSGAYLGPNVSTDRFDFGSPIPKYNGSFTLNLRVFRSINFYALADWATEFKVLNFTNVFSYRFGNNPEFNRLANQLNLAGRPGVAANSAVDNTITRLTPNTPEYQAAAERFARLDHTFNANFIEDGDFLKLREISVNYSLKDWLPRLNADRYFRDVVVGFSARNVWTTTKYSGPDPEVNHNGARSLTRGNDFLTLQSPRAYNFIFRFSL
ncbi:MAG: TonB-dependent receptor [candidate division KSB1 bacterium]|nr:TonB-dependent receptor [candidate division KSB1 bacterium]MDZ7366418.1 TonB-dependent receptor [candidate division KSB1 bacterium]MDZ7404620.1 TonB-dependent receptor [candidate division KSB1 bacterium]